MNLPLPHIRAVAFDLDGTLCDSVPDLAASANAMRQQLSMPVLPQSEIQSYVGDGIASLVHRALTADVHGTADDKLWQQGFTAFVRHYAEHIADATCLYPNAEDALALLKSLGLPLALVTNKSARLAVKLVEALGIEPYFSIIIGGDSLLQRKPDAEPLLHAAQALGVLPAEMLMVGDSRNDILAARAAGCPCAGVLFGYGDMAKLAEAPDTRPNWQIGALTELYDLLRAQETQP